MDLATWLRTLGLERYEATFRENEVDFALLPKLTPDDLTALGVSMVGHRRKLLDAIETLREGRPPIGERADAAELPQSRPPFHTAPVEPERRQLSILLCDLVGSTALAAQLDPEDLRDIVSVYQRQCASVISRYEGHVAKYLGDGVLAYFGYPHPHEDDAERAVRAGLELTQAVAALRPHGDIALQVRVGIATGLVVVGDLIGEGAGREEAVVGETPNLAARLQTIADPGCVVIASGTRQLIGRLFDLADLGTYRLKGISDPVHAWQVLGSGTAEGRFEALHGHGLTPLVGRDHEVGLLWDRWEQAKDGEGQVVLLSGEPGIGKSRLLLALRERLGDEQYTPLTHFCSPYHQNTALFPIITLLERGSNLRRDEPAARQLEKVEALLAPSAADLDEAVPLVAALLSIPVDGRYPPPNLSPQRQKQRTLEILVDQVGGLAARQPVVAIYEDVHWSDPTTLELLGLLIDQVQRLPVLVVITFRPEFVPPWTSFAHVTALTINRLAQRRGAALVEFLTAGKALPGEVVEHILAKTDGVPLFVEELTKAVLESGLVHDEGDRYSLRGPLPALAIPATLQDSLMARLGRLAPVKEVAQIGAVIGREFPYDLLETVADRPRSELLLALDQLISSELITQRGEPPAARYSFKHALVQDAAYESMLRSRRRQLHARIAQALEHQTVSPPELVAEHYTRASMFDEASRYWLLAGERAKLAYANREATSHLTRCLSVLSEQGASSEDRHPTAQHTEIAALALLGDLASLGGELHQANQYYDRAVALSPDEDIRTRIMNKHHHAHSTIRDGARIIFYTHGSGGDTLLLVNPLVYGLALFQPIVDRLCQDFRIITIDCRGTGGSDPLTRPFPLDEHVKDVAAVIDALGGQPVIGVGLSRGSNLLIRLAASRPELIRKLVPVGCPLVPGGFDTLANYSGYWQQCPDAYRRGDVEGLLRILGSFMYTEPGTEELKRLLIERGLRLPPETVLSFYDPDPDVDVRDLLEQISIPVLVTHGMADELIPYVAAEYLAGALPNARLYGFSGKGHLPIFTAPDEFCAVVSEFVRTPTSESDVGSKAP
jgi:class 3 adenylate cyclase/pimeloyl-ACP methyl ester carboxylesterase